MKSDRRGVAARPGFHAQAIDDEIRQFPGASTKCLHVADVRFLSALRRGNVHGALDLGLTPGFLPGRVTLEAASEHFAAAWSGVPSEPGVDATGILAGAAAGTIDTIVLLGCDPIADFPDRARVRAAFESVRFLVAVGPFASDAAERADVVLPTSVWGEKSGSTTNLEGRVMRLARLVTPEGVTMPDWRVAVELAARLGSDFDLETVEEVQDEVARLAPALAGVDADLLRRARDGAVVPIAHRPDEIVLGADTRVGPALSWEPIPPGVAADETTLSSVGTGVVEASGTGAAATIKPGLVEEGVPPAQAAAEAEELTRAAGEALAAHPELHRWTPGAASHPPEVPVDAYSLRLVAARTLYDAGSTAASGPSLAHLAPGAALLVHPNDVTRIGVAHDGDEVRVTSARGTVVLPVRADPGTRPGTAFLAINHAGPASPADLIDVAAPLTELRVETIR